MSKHTPGPWLVREFATYNRAVVQPWVMDSIPDGPNGKVVANAIACCSLTNPDCEANANLIAAAPELLDTLERIAREYPSVAGPNDCPPAPHACPKCEIYFLLAEALGSKVQA